VSTLTQIVNQRLSEIYECLKTGSNFSVAHVPLNAKNVATEGSKRLWEQGKLNIKQNAGLWPLK
jgi:hypothetical protein